MAERVFRGSSDDVRTAFDSVKAYLDNTYGIPQMQVINGKIVAYYDHPDKEGVVHLSVRERCVGTNGQVVRSQVNLQVMENNRKFSSPLEWALITLEQENIFHNLSRVVKKVA